MPGFVLQLASFVRMAVRDADVLVNLSSAEFRLNHDQPSNCDLGTIGQHDVYHLGINEQIVDVFASQYLSHEAH